MALACFVLSREIAPPTQTPRRSPSDQVPHFFQPLRRLVFTAMDKFMESLSCGSPRSKKKQRVALVGSGNWGSAIATKIGVNVLKHTDLFVPEVQMWVFEEYVKESNADGTGGKWTRPARGAKPPEGKTWVDEGYSPLTQLINEVRTSLTSPQAASAQRC